MDTAAAAEQERGPDFRPGRSLKWAAAIIAALVVTAIGIGVRHDFQQRALDRNTHGLVGVHWMLVRAAQQTVHGSYPQGLPDIRFSRNGYYGTDGCNEFSGTVSYQPGAFIIKSSVSTAVGCVGLAATGQPGGGDPVHWSLRAGLLTLTDGRGAALTYRAA